MRHFPSKDADKVEFTPTDHLSSTNVQDAIEELNDEIRHLIHPYGVTWDEDADTYARTGAIIGQPTGQSISSEMLPIQAAMRRCILNDSGGVEYYLSATDSTKREDGVIASDLTGADGQVMVQIPAFYYRYSYANTAHTWEISLSPAEGFSLHHAFIKNGADVDYRYMSAYEGVLYDTSASRYTNGLSLPAHTVIFTNATSILGLAALTHPFTNLEAGDKFVIAGTTNNNGTFTVASKTDDTITTVEALTDETSFTATFVTEKNWGTDVLSSVSGKAPMNIGTRANFRAAAATRGTGWRQMDYDLVSAIQLLYLVEYASFYSQSMIGAGLTNFGGADWSFRNDSNPIETTGNSNSDGNATASVDNGTGATGSYMSYRGIENFYGHIWDFVDGININNNVPYVSNDDTVFADDTATDYTDLGITLINSDGWQETLEQTARGFLPASVGGSSSTYVTNGYYQGADWRTMILGGHATFSSMAGFFGMSVSEPAASINTVIGGRLSF